MNEVIDEVITVETVEKYNPMELVSLIADRYNYVCIDAYSHDYIHINNEGEFEEVENINPFINSIFKSGFIEKYLKIRKLFHKIKCEK